MVNSALKTKGKPTDPSQECEIICRKGKKEADNWETAVMLPDRHIVNTKRNVCAFSGSVLDLSYL